MTRLWTLWLLCPLTFLSAQVLPIPTVPFDKEDDISSLHTDLLGPSLPHLLARLNRSALPDRPKPEPIQQRTATPLAEPHPIARSVVRGVIQSDQKRILLIEHSAGVTSLQVGDTLYGYTLSSIGSNSVSFQNDSETIALPVHAGAQ